MPIVDAYTMGILLERGSHRDLSIPKNVGLESRCVQSTDYNPETNDLTVVFVERGTYLYHNVPVDVYAQFATAESQGRYFNLYIREQYDYERVS